MAGPAFTAALSLDLSEVVKFFKSYAETPERIAGGVAAIGEAANYALVWEYGNTRQTKQGPRTVLGVNPNGETVWLSSQAPLGYISIHTEEYLGVIDQEMNAITLDGNGMTELEEKVRQANDKISPRIADIIRSNAPKDTWQLSDSILPMSSGDSDLGSFDSVSDIFVI